MKKLFQVALLTCAMALATGCATGVKGSPRRICYEAGVQPGTPEFSSCWRNVAHSQGTVVFDDPEAIALITGAIAARNGNNSVVSTPADRQSTAGIARAREYMASRKDQDLYDLVGGPLVMTNFCYVYAYSARSIISGNKLIFVNEGKSCLIKQIVSR